MGLDIGQLSPWVVGAYLVPLLAVLAWIVVGAFKDGELPMMPGLLAIMLMGFGMFAVYEPKPDEWETFKAAHNCKVVAKRDGHSNNGIGVTTRGSVGYIIGDDTPDQVAYKCDDCVTYWKNAR
ncbi:hypothetical protein N1C12_004252 [Salmonella enterica subsp. enterica]|nr:hypothetical protein [Salmonella enterica subsp. enterica]